MSSSRISAWELRTLCLITGASRGLGKCIAVRFAERFPSNSVIILTARDSSCLEQTKATIERVRPDIRVYTWSIDLSGIDKAVVDQYFDGIWSEIHQVPSDFEQMMLIHCAGSVGNISEWLTGQSSAEDVNKFWQLNVTSVIILNSSFWNLCRKSNDIYQQKIVINISSLLALQPMKSYSLYCSSKAARDMMFSVMALEEPEILVLSYAPGPLDTDMMIENLTKPKDSDSKNLFIGMQRDNQLLSCDQTVDRLATILDKNHFKSGSHVDYYDNID